MRDEFASKSFLAVESFLAVTGFVQLGSFRIYLICNSALPRRRPREGLSRLR
jgi:hypothetical protein